MAVAELVFDASQAKLDAPHSLSLRSLFATPFEMQASCTARQLSVEALVVVPVTDGVWKDGGVMIVAMGAELEEP